MALVSHLITALEQSNDPNVNTLNTVSGAVVSLFDSQGQAVLLYDDESGSNPSTTKTTDSSGQVVVWVTAGEYDEAVNGSTLRRVSVGGVSVSSYATTSSMQASRPTDTGLRAENRERGFAQYELAAPGYVAQAGDIVAANGRVWAIIINESSTIVNFGASESADDNQMQIIDFHDRLEEGATLTVPDGEFKTSTLSFTKRLNVVIKGSLVRSDLSTMTDSVLIIAGDESTLSGGGTVSWNAGVGTDSGRGEAIRITGDRVYATNITGADTSTTTGNGWYIEGSNCTLDSCRSKNCSYAGVRTNMIGRDANDDPVGVCTIKDFIAENCRRGWVNNRDALHIYIDNFQIVNPKPGADVQLLGETGDDIKFKNLTITNTTIKTQLANGANIVKFVGIQEVNLTDCMFDTDGAVNVTPLRLQNEHAGTDTYQVNRLNMSNVKLVSTGTEIINVDHEDQWRIESSSCAYTLIDGSGLLDMLDAGMLSYWVSIDDEFRSVNTACEDIFRVVDIQTGTSDRYMKIVRPRIMGPSIDHIFRFVTSNPSVGQVSCVDAHFENTPNASGYLTGSNSNEALIRIGGGTQYDRQFSCLLSNANALTPADYQSGDRVYVRNPTDGAKVVRVKAATQWNDS